MADPIYRSLVAGDLTFAGYDQGIDFTGTGQVKALGPGKVTRVERGTFQFKQGVGSIITYLITGGPLKGKSVYLMEAVDIPSGLKVGDPVSRGQVIGKVNSTYPGVETGWAGPSGGPAAQLGTNAGGHDFWNSVTQLSQGKQAPATGGGHAGVTPGPTGGGGDVGGAVAGAVGGVAHDVAAPFEAAVSVADFLGKLADPNLWLRGLQIIAGAGLAFAGLLLLARQIGLQPPIEAPPPVQAAARVVE